jgi:hypothetical protein
LDGCPDAETNAAKKVKVWISESSLVVFCGKTRKKKDDSAKQYVGEAKNNDLWQGSRAENQWGTNNGGT